MLCPFGCGLMEMPEVLTNPPAEEVCFIHRAFDGAGWMHCRTCGFSFPVAGDVADPQVVRQIAAGHLTQLTPACVESFGLYRQLHAAGGPAVIHKLADVVVPDSPLRQVCPLHPRVSLVGVQHPMREIDNPIDAPEGLVTFLMCPYCGFEFPYITEVRVSHFWDQFRRVLERFSPLQMRRERFLGALAAPVQTGPGFCHVCFLPRFSADTECGLCGALPTAAHDYEARSRQLGQIQSDALGAGSAAMRSCAAMVARVNAGFCPMHLYTREELWGLKPVRAAGECHVAGELWRCSRDSCGFSVSPRYLYPISWEQVGRGITLARRDTV